MSTLLTPEQVAEQFGITVAEVHKYRLKKQWPYVKFGRNEVRFSPEQIEQIVAMQTVAVAEQSRRPVSIPGQTSRSQARSA